jgi:hypothetical protein
MNQYEYLQSLEQKRVTPVKLNVDMYQDLYEEIIAAAEKQNISPSAFVRIACRDRIAWVMVPEIQPARKANPLARAFKKIADMLA